MIYEGYNVHQTWLSQRDGRKYISLYSPITGDKVCLAYARYLMEQHLDKYLETSDHVHHIDGNFHNDVIENLEVINEREHRSKHRRQDEITEKLCVKCSKIIYLTRLQMHNFFRNRRQGKVGPVCSRKCGALMRYSNEVRK